MCITKLRKGKRLMLTPPFCSYCFWFLGYVFHTTYRGIFRTTSYGRSFIWAFCDGLSTRSRRAYFRGNTYSGFQLLITFKNWKNPPLAQQKWFLTFLCLKVDLPAITWNTLLKWIVFTVFGFLWANEKLVVWWSEKDKDCRDRWNQRAFSSER